MKTQQPPGTARHAGRPRSEKAERAILEATLDLLGDGLGVAELSIESIAAKAGVGKTTIYRRWSNKEDLVVDALTSLVTEIPKPAGGSARADLVALLRALRNENGNVRTRCLYNLANNERDRFPHLMERFRQCVVEPRQEAVRAIIRRGVAEGEFRADLDVEVAMMALAGAMFYFNKWGDARENAADLAERIVDQVMKGMLPASVSRTGRAGPETI